MRGTELLFRSVIPIGVLLTCDDDDDAALARRSPANETNFRFSFSLSLSLSLSSLFRSSFFFKHTQRLEIAFWRFFLSLLFSLLFFLFRRFFLLSLSPGGEIPPRKSSRYKSRSTAEMLAPERNTKKSQLPSPPIGKQERRKVYPLLRKYKSNKPKFEYNAKSMQKKTCCVCLIEKMRFFKYVRASVLSNNPQFCLSASLG